MDRFIIIIISSSIVREPRAAICHPVHGYAATPREMHVVNHADEIGYRRRRRRRRGAVPEKGILSRALQCRTSVCAPVRVSETNGQCARVRSKRPRRIVLTNRNVIVDAKSNEGLRPSSAPVRWYRERAQSNNIYFIIRFNAERRVLVTLSRRHACI